MSMLAVSEDGGGTYHPLDGFAMIGTPDPRPVSIFGETGPQARWFTVRGPATPVPGSGVLHRALADGSLVWFRRMYDETIGYCVLARVETFCESDPVAGGGAWYHFGLTDVSAPLVVRVTPTSAP